MLGGAARERFALPLVHGRTGLPLHSLGQQQRKKEGDPQLRGSGVRAQDADGAITERIRRDAARCSRTLPRPQPVWWAALAQPNCAGTPVC